MSLYTYHQKELIFKAVLRSYEQLNADGKKKKLSWPKLGDRIGHFYNDLKEDKYRLLVSNELRQGKVKPPFTGFGGDDNLRQWAKLRAWDPDVTSHRPCENDQMLTVLELWLTYPPNVKRSGLTREKLHKEIFDLNFAMYFADFFHSHAISGRSIHANSLVGKYSAILSEKEATGRTWVIKIKEALNENLMPVSFYDFKFNSYNLNNAKKDVIELNRTHEGYIIFMPKNTFILIAKNIRKLDVIMYEAISIGNSVSSGEQAKSLVLKRIDAPCLYSNGQATNNEEILSSVEDAMCKFDRM